MDPWLRMSAWLPPGLALGWLAVLATFVHGVASLLIAWGASVFLAVLAAALLAWLRSAASSRSSSDTVGSPAGQQGLLPQAASDPAPQIGPHAPLEPSDEKERMWSETSQSVSGSVNAAPAEFRSPDSLPRLSSEAEAVQSADAPRPVPDRPASGTAGTAQQSETAKAATVTLGLRVLTATEAAEVLRVDTDVITTAISKGELPGNQVGGHWRVEQGALARWLQGAYGQVSDPRSPSSAEPEID